MLNDFKPTHDPNLDTFKVQYLLGISAILAILFPHDYRNSEVRSYPRGHTQSQINLPSQLAPRNSTRA
jgi:energy-converting hydrogenase Eha subunit F